MLVDAGDLFYDKFRLPDDERSRWEDTAAFLIEQFNATGVDAITLGDRDTYLGVDALRELRRKAKFPFLVANLLDVATGEPMFDAHVVKEVAGIKVGLFGVTLEAAARRPADGAAPWRAEDPIATARKEVAALRAEGAEIIVALTHLTEAEERTMAREVPGITAILGGNGVRMLQHPECVDGTFVADAFSKGKYVSAMLLHLWSGQPAGAPLADRFRRDGLDKQIEQVDARIASYERILAAKEAQAQKGAPVEPAAGVGARRASAVNVDFYRKQLVKFRAEKQALELDLEGASAVDPRANYIAYELMPVRKDLEDDEQVAQAVETFRKKWPKLDGKARAGVRPLPGAARDKGAAAPTRKAGGRRAPKARP